MCLWLPDWPLQNLRAARPELRGQPLAVCVEDGPRGRRVRYCSAEAAARGVRPGMPVAEAVSVTRESAGGERGTGDREPGATPRGASALTPHPSTLNFRAARREPRPPVARSLANPESRIPNPESFLHLAAHDPQADRAALLELAAWCEQFSPLVGLEEAEHAECLLLDITGLGPLFGGERRLVALALERLAERGYQARAAVAETVGAAWALAHFRGESRAEGSSTKSEVGSRRSEQGEQGSGNGEPGATPRGASALNPHPSTLNLSEARREPRPPELRSGQETTPQQEHAPSAINNQQSTISNPHSLSSLPLAALRLSPKLVAVFRELGIERIGQLEQLPRASLAVRFGEEPARRLDQLHGASAEPIVAHRPLLRPAASWCFEHPTTHSDVVEHVLDQLLDRVAGQLAARDHGATELACRFSCEGRQSLEIKVSFFQPTAHARHWRELARLQLERRRLPAPVSEIHVEATATDRLVWRQQDLLAAGGGNTARELGNLINRLINRLGRETASRVALQPQAQPERAYRLTPLTATARRVAGRSVRSSGGRGSRRAGTKSSPETAAWQDSGPARGAGSKFGPQDRPLRLYQPPQPVSAVAVAPAGLPARFTWRGQDYVLARHWGPERIQTGWWQGRSIERDYYRVETTTGGRFWIFRRLTDRRWFLHGEFA